MACCHVSPALRSAEPLCGSRTGAHTAVMRTVLTLLLLAAA
ncbi:DUF4124 domain-containing protein, partial [Xanthomonas oryzae pv. oryzae]